MDTSVAGVTVSDVGAEVMFPNVAVMKVVPGASPVAWPFDGDVLLIDAIVGLLEDQVTELVISSVGETL